MSTHFRACNLCEAICGLEFTVQDGTLYMLQTRSGKRTAQAALKRQGVIG